VENDQQALVLPWYFTVPAGICLMVTGTLVCANKLFATISNKADIESFAMFGKIG